MLDSFKNIFSISDYSEERYLLTLFGIKFKIQKREYAKRRKTNPYYYYVKNNIDITTIPPATGQIRELQLANLQMLKELDYVCKKNNLNYWLEFGTLIGAVRHKGFIPWDDDIDIGMPREDYERLVEIFNSTTRNRDIYAEYTDPIIRIKFKKSECIYIDLFPYDKYGSLLDDKDAIKKSNKLKKIRKSIKQKCKKHDLRYFLNMISKVNKEKVLVNQVPDNIHNIELLRGIEVLYSEKNWFSHYDTIYPLNTIDFEGYKFSCVNKPIEHLSNLYGDFMSYPKKIGCGHNMYKNLSPDEHSALNTLINKGEDV